MPPNQLSKKVRGWLATLAAGLIALTSSTPAAENTTWVAGITEAAEDATLSSSVLGIIRARPSTASLG